MRIRSLKRIISFFICIMILLAVCILPVTASTAARLVDEEGLLTAEEADRIGNDLDRASEDLGIDVVVVTVDSLEGKTSEAYADDYYDYHDYADDGILFLVAMEEREFAISTKGTAEYVFNEDVLDSMVDDFLPSLSNGNYSVAFSSYCQDVRSYYTDPQQGIDSYISNYDEEGQPVYDYPEEDSESLPGRLIKYLPFSGVLGLISSFFITGQKKAALTSVKNQAAAGSYIKEQNLRDRKDIFLYHTVTRTAKPKDHDKDRGGFSGGHVSSSGSHHGGTHGKF